MRVFEAKGFIGNGNHGSFVSISPNWPTGPDDENGRAEGSHVEACLYLSIAAAEDLLAQLPEAIATAKGETYVPVDMVALQSENAALKAKLAAIAEKLVDDNTAAVSIIDIAELVAGPTVAEEAAGEVAR